ncbi:RDD family protein [Lacibacter cauensis]|uniref:RDD family protein n=1 Tax=Lacibacter cauensis TaxID=510947 RepID=A0A562SKC6_9BACT|nr:RDD family protein [Lacibacter cauensis]TWI81717.1 RDD family protein [Lacibacter cauensis]
MEEQTNVLSDFTEPQFKFASTGQRLLNFIVDTVAFYVLNFLLGLITGLLAFALRFDGDGYPGGSIQLLFLIAFVASYFLYYTLLEGAKGKTLGKLLTKTKAIQVDGSPLGYKKAFLRTLCRLIPFELFSVFFGGLMWHDSLTYTMTVQDA